MKCTSKLTCQLAAFNFMLLLCLSGCSSSTSTSIPSGELENKIYLSHQGYLVKFYQEQEKLQAKVEENLPGGSRQVYQLPVHLVAGVDLGQLASWNQKHQQSFIHVLLPKKAQIGYVYVGPTGLMGGGNVNGTDGHQLSSLHRACLYGKIDAIRLFLLQGANPNVQDIFGSSPLHFAACKGNIEVVKLLIDKGAHVNVQDIEDWTPLHIAACDGNLELVSLLLACGANRRIRNSDGLTPSGLAMQMGHTAIANFLEQDYQVDYSL